jgi:YVTN family beta-propeller protein
MAQRFRYLSTCIHLCLAALVATTTLCAQPYAYVANNGGNTVAVINLATYGVAAQIPVPATPSGIAVTPDGSTVYVSSSYNNNVSAIRTSDNTIIATIGVGTNPTRLAVSPNGALVYVVDYVTNQITAINHASKTVTATIAVGFRPTFVAFSPDSTRAYVTNLFGSTVSVIDTGANAVIKTFPTGAFPTGVAVTPDGQHIYVSNQGTNSVTVHDTSGNIVTTIPGFSTPNALAIAPNGKAFVSNGNASAVSVIDTASNTVIARPSVGSLPTSVAISTDGTHALVTNEYSFTVSAIDTSSYAVSNTVPTVGVYPMVVATQAAGGGGGGGCTVSAALAQGNSLSFPSSGGSATINVTASASNCTWSVAGSGFANITPPNGSGNGSVTVSAGANGNAGSLSENFTVAGSSFTVTEQGLGCSYSASVTAGSLSFGFGGGSATITVTTLQGCAWTPSGPNWVSLNPPSSSGPGTFTVTAGANNTSNTLNGLIVVPGSPSLPTSEAGVPCVATPSGNQSLSAGGGSGSVTITAPVGCAWTATDVADSSWFTINGAGSGNGSAAYTYTANPGTGNRVANVAVNSGNFSLTQAGSVFSPIRVNAAGAAFTDNNGHAWSADSPGKSYSVTMATITDPGGAFTSIYQKHAYAGGAGLTYTFTGIPNGTFNVTLHFAETYLTVGGARVMNISINNQSVDTSVDVLSRAGAVNKAYSNTYQVTVNGGGQISITIAPANGSNPAMLSGLEIQ